MKVVITGKNSYIGNHIEKWLIDKCDGISVCQLDVETDEWENYDFVGTDAVIHVAGIVHRPKLKDESLYERVNAELPLKVATRAKDAGVKQFVFFSTMAVYGKDKALKPNVVTGETPIAPTNLYGQSKYRAETLLSELADENLVLSIVRPPNVYGYGCKGNYIGGFLKLANLPVAFPYAFNGVKQSMIYIGNLCEAIRIIVEKRLSGVYCPRDEAVSAVELVRALRKAEGKNKRFSKFLGFFVKVFRFIPVVKKIYGGIEYANISDVDNGSYRVVTFDEAIERTINSGDTI